MRKQLSRVSYVAGAQDSLTNLLNQWHTAATGQGEAAAKRKAEGKAKPGAKKKAKAQPPAQEVKSEANPVSESAVGSAWEDED